MSDGGLPKRHYTSEDSKDMERFRRLMIYGNEIIAVTENNINDFNVPLLAARLLAAQQRGEFLLIDCDKNITVLKKLPEAPKGVIKHMSVGLYDTAVYDDLEVKTEDTPRNRAERRHGVKKDQPLWRQHADWRTRAKHTGI